MTTRPGPPAELPGPLELAPADWSVGDVYHVLTALVVPRPIAWVSTVGADGVPNVAPHSYFNLVSHDPPHVAFSTTAVRDTLTNLRARPEFVVNVVTMDLVEPMNLTSADFPPEQDEFRWAGLTAVESRTVGVPRVGEAKAHLECRVVHELAVGTATLVIGEVLHLHVDPEVWRDGRVDPRLLDPVCRLAGSGYAALGDVFRLDRPRWTDLERQEADARRNQG
ncbi:flavin reductase family protein [Lentzea sp. NPDC058450]|uniref:flavin reductase family protein n=1 Tax=Lentzea sp. NPDC058450 TaxID=3346505 RepID=UPI00365EFEEF